MAPCTQKAEQRLVPGLGTHRWDEKSIGVLIRPHYGKQVKSGAGYMKKYFSSSSSSSSSSWC
ncbi:hypothetical protein E2C01_081959 [Portunus trituberculatus]|uniref:Uncharacterized protein n=1 Tax=Portunus trituberculatus TaxID=210409 RepID=A0A5B7J2H8_PORTR|nr:hypothetical protein [Portunus trituberculatus]